MMNKRTYHSYDVSSQGFLVIFDWMKLKGGELCAQVISSQSLSQFKV